MAATAFADPIHTSASSGNLAGVQAELDKGVDVNAKDSLSHPPLHHAAFWGHTEVVELLIDNGADVKAEMGRYGRTALHWTGWYKHKEIAELLIANGADVNAKSDWGDTPLHYAAEAGSKEVAELLIAAGADVNAKNVNDGLSHRWTPLHDAAYHGHKETAELLIDAGADVNAKNDVGETPLHWAANEGHKEIVELLITNGADVNAQGQSIRTPLHYAAGEGHMETVELLIANGANVNAHDKDGKTPLKLTIEELAHLVEMSEHLGEVDDFMKERYERDIQALEEVVNYLKNPLRDFHVISEVPTVYAMARGSGSCNGVDISGSFVILYGSKYNLRIVKKSDGSSVFKADTQLEGNLNGVMTVALNEDLFSTSFSITDELMAVPYVDGKWDTTEAVLVTRYRNLSFDAAKKTKAAQWQSAE